MGESQPVDIYGVGEREIIEIAKAFANGFGQQPLLFVGGHLHPIKFVCGSIPSYDGGGK